MDASNSNQTPESMSADEAKCSKAEEKPDYISEHPVSSFQLHRETSQNQILASSEEESSSPTISVKEEMAFKPTAKCDFCDAGNCSENLPSSSTATTQPCISQQWLDTIIESPETTESETVSLSAKSALEEDFVAKETGSNVCEYKVYDKQEIRVKNAARKSVIQYAGIKAPEKNERSDAENNSTFKKSVDKTKEHTLSNFHGCRTNLPSLHEEAFCSRKTIVNKSKNISKTKEMFTESTKTDEICVSSKLIQSGRKISESEIRKKNNARKSLIKDTSVKSSKKNEGDNAGYSSIFEKTANRNKEQDLSNRYSCSANLRSKSRKGSISMSNDMSITEQNVTKIKKAVATKKSNPIGERLSEISQINKYKKKGGPKIRKRFALKSFINYNWNPTGKMDFEALLPVQHEGSIRVQENVLENTMEKIARKFPESSSGIPPGESDLKTLLLSTNQHQVFPPSGENIKTKKTARKSIYSKRTGLSDKNEEGGAGNSLTVKETVKETKQLDLPTSYSSIGNLPSTSKGELSDQKCNVNTPKDENTTKLELTKSKETTGSETINPTDGSFLKTLLLSKK